MKKVKGKAYALRIDAHLVEPLQKLKKHNRRSLNAEINAALEQWVAKTVKPSRKKRPAAEEASAATGEAQQPQAEESHVAQATEPDAEQQHVSQESKAAGSSPVGAGSLHTPDLGRSPR